MIPHIPADDKINFLFEHKLLARGLVEQHERKPQDEQVAHNNHRVNVIDMGDVNVVEWEDIGGQRADRAPA